MNISEELNVFDRISFIEKDHSYLIDGKLNKSPSVTQLLKKFKNVFNVDKAAAGVAKRQKTTSAYIKAEWEMNNLYSTTLGGMFHKYVENFYTGKDEQFSGNTNRLGFEEKEMIKVNLPKIVSYFHNFHTDHPSYVCHKNEFVVGDIDDTKVCGMLDMLVSDEKTGSVELWDFKTNKKIAHSIYNNLLYPFDDLPEGQINEYTIQLNTYKHFIEKYTNIQIDKMKILWFNVVNENYQIIELDCIQDKIKLMLDRYKSQSLFV